MQSASFQDNSPAKVGYRLANEPFPEGLDTLKLKEPQLAAALKFDDATLGTTLNLKRTPAFRSKHRKCPSAPATPVTTFFEINIDDSVEHSPCNVSLLNQGLSNVSLLNNSSPRVVVVDMKLDSMSEGDKIDVNTVSKLDMPPSKKNVPCKTRKSLENVPIPNPMCTSQTGLDKIEGLPKPQESQENLGPASNNTKSPQKGSSIRKPVLSLTSLDSALLPELVPSISKESISSILSQMSDGSVRSTFSIEPSDQPTVVYDEIPASLARLSPPSCVSQGGHKNKSHRNIPAALGAMPEIERLSWGELSKANMPVKALSMESLDSGTEEDEDAEMQGQQKKLTKSVSIDSGKGMSVDDLAALGVIVYKKPSTSSYSHSRRERKSESFFPFNDGSSPVLKSPMVKSVSTPDVHSCPFSTQPFATTPTRLTCSQTLPAMQDINDSTFNASVVQDKIRLFNSLAHPHMRSVSEDTTEDVLIQLSARDSPRLLRSTSTGGDTRRRRYLSDDQRSDFEKFTPLITKSTSEVSQPAESFHKLDEKTCRHPASGSLQNIKVDYESMYDLNQSYEEAVSNPNEMRRQNSLTVSVKDISTPQSLRKVLGDHNVTISPQEMDKVVKLPPLDFFPSRPPLKLAKSTKIRTPNRRKHIMHRYSPARTSSPGKPVKRLGVGASPKVYHSTRHYHTPNRSSRYHPSSPKNPLSRGSPRIYPRSPAHPLVVQALTPKRTPSRASSVTPARMSSRQGHVEEDMEWRV